MARLGLMIDIRDLRADPDRARASQTARGEDPGAVDAALAADERHRSALAAFESARAEQKSFGKQVAQAKGEEKQALVAQAIAVDKAGLGVPAPDTPDWAPELRDRFRDDPAFEAAFFALTPGRQRAYNLHVSGAKQSATRIARIDRHADRILAGKGLNDR